MGGARVPGYDTRAHIKNDDGEKRMTTYLENLRCQYESENHLVPREGAVFSWSYGTEDLSALASVKAVVVDSRDTVVWSSPEYPEPVVQTEYTGACLSPGARYSLLVTATDRGGAQHTARIAFDTVPEAFAADWIWLDNAHVRPTTVNAHYTGYSSPYFRRRFAVEGEVRRAMLYASALGVYELQLNGRRLHDTWFDPGWTDYRRRIAYQAYDVTEWLSQGENRLDACLGEGWYRGFILFHDKNYGDIPLKLFCELRVEYADGRRCTVASDGQWKAGTGPLRYSDFQMGEFYAPTPEEGTDAFYRYPVCAQPDQELTGRLVPQLGPPIREIASFTPRLLHWKEGAAVLDVGQNISGFLRLRLRGLPAGREIRIVCGEMLEADGGVYTENLRLAEQVNRYIAVGRAEETCQPHFTVHGFQYAEIHGLLPEELEKAEITAVALSADCRRTGDFSCGHPLVNKLYSNLVWGQRDNFSTVPTDCPQRNERIGWTGDAQIFCATACYNMDCQTYYHKYCRDLFDAQFADGAFPDVAPLLYGTDGALFFERANAAWADAGIIIPWRLYTFYRNREHLREAYPHMAAYARYLLAHSSDGLYCRADYSDWLSIRDDTVRAVLATAYAAYDMELMHRAAGVLGMEEDAAFYARAFEQYRRAFYRHFVDGEKRILGDSQTSYVLALRFGIARAEDCAAFAAHLARRIRHNGGHLSSGFVGISYLLPVLCDYGYADLAYQLLLNESYPSWLYSVVNGATTIWERWNSYTREGGFGDVSMNSFNHYSLGSVGEWLFSYCAGIRPAEDTDGFSRITLCPCPDERLGHCSGTYDSVYGRISSAWRYENGGITFTFSVPARVEAVALLPAEGEMQTLRYTAQARFAIPLTPGTHSFFVEAPAQQSEQAV